MALSYINNKRTKERGLALLQVYTKNRKVMPTLETYVNDYFDIVQPSSSNRSLVKETTRVLKSTYEDYKKNINAKTAITIML